MAGRVLGLVRAAAAVGRAGALGRSIAALPRAPRRWQQLPQAGALTGFREVSTGGGAAGLAADAADSASASAATDGLRISPACAKRLNELNRKKGYSPPRKLRVEVVPGGCNGLSYKMTLTDTTGEDDRIFQADGAEVVVDEMSLSYIAGSTIDYQMELIKAAFVVADNPQAEGSCGCKTSFTPRDEDM